MATIKFTLKPGECKTVGGSRVCNRWKKNTAASGKDYEDGIRNPKRSWGKATCEAGDCYKAGVDKAHSQGAFRKGVKRAGNKGWKIPTIIKGPGRFAQGVSRGGQDYHAGFAPYFKVIRRTNLPARFAKRDPRNINRCSAMAAALGRAKAGKGVSGEVICPDE